MVFFVKFNEMEEDGRRGKKVGLWRRLVGSSWSSTAIGSDQHSNASLGPTSPTRERRPLRSVPTIGTQYKVDPEVLAKEYVEKETKYMGTVTDISNDFDPGNRAMVLSLLDEKRKINFFPPRLSWRQDVILSFSVYNIKVLWRDGEDLIHRIPTHRIAATGFVQDDSETFLFIKFASEVNEEMSNMAFFCCESKVAAQEICYLTQQLFQLAYTNSTMDFFDKSIQDGAVTPKHHSCSTDDSAEKKDTVKLSYPSQQSQLSNSDTSGLPIGLHNGHRPTALPTALKASTLPLSSTPQRRHSPRSTHAASSTPSSPVSSRSSRRLSASNGSTRVATNRNHQQLQLNEYIEVLKERLTEEELQSFAELLHNFRNGSLSIQIFCDRLMSIYTEQRTPLLLGMRHFIPEPLDRSYFESFLERHRIETGSDDVRWWDRPPKSRTISETEGGSSTTILANEFSSNSDIISASRTSNEDSGEWQVTAGYLKLDDSKLSTLKKRHSKELQAIPSQFSPGSVTPGRVEPGKLSPPNPLLDFYIDLDDIPRDEEADRDAERETSPDLSRFRDQKRVKKKKARGKSPSAAEFGAPIPSLATGGTDGDLDSSLDKKSKLRSAKNKRKEKLPRSNDKEQGERTGSKEKKGAFKWHDDDPPPFNGPGESSHAKKKFFKTKGVKTKVKKDTENQSSSAVSTPEPQTVVEPLAKDERKASKSSDSTLTFL